MFKYLFHIFFNRIPFDGILEVEINNKKYSFGKPSGEKVIIKILKKGIFRRLVINGDIGFGEAFFLKEFETDDLKLLLLWFERNKDKFPSFRKKSKMAFFFGWARGFSRIAHWLNKNTRPGSKKNISAHYDVSNDFYRLWLDPTMTYSSAIFNGAGSLEEAQKNKYRKICEKIGLKPGDHVLEIGSGWGGISVFAAKNYGCNITTVTISKKQYEFTKKLIKKEGLEDKIKLRLEDYRDISGQYDKIVSIEMMEALGHEFVPLFINKCNSLLKSQGKLGLQFILYPDEYYHFYLTNQNYIKKYIFPGGELLSLKIIKKALSDTGELAILSEERIGQDYAKTLNAWRSNLSSKKEEILKLGFDEHFFLKWYYYFAYCEVGFETGYIDDMQMIIKKN
jgi:cyclopropane-fatty-acyl-phospholipid synthase